MKASVESLHHALWHQRKVNKSDVNISLITDITLIGTQRITVATTPQDKRRGLREPLTMSLAQRIHFPPSCLQEIQRI